MVEARLLPPDIVASQEAAGSGDLPHASESESTNVGKRGLKQIVECDIHVTDMEHNQSP